MEVYNKIDLVNKVVDILQSPVRNLALFLTEKCNMACPYCFAANREGRNIDLELAKKAMDSLLFRDDNLAEKVSITWWGGEPLVVFDMLRELTFYAEDRANQTGKKIKFSLPTNVSLLNEDILEFLIEHKTGLSLSLDGDAGSQNVRCFRGGKGSFNVVKQKLELLRNRFGNNMPPVRMTVTPENVSKLSHNIKFFIDQGIKQICFMPTEEVQWTEEQLKLFETEQYKVVDYWVESLQTDNIWHSIMWDKDLARREMKRRGTYDGTPGIFCGAGGRLLAVDIRGDIFPCQRFVFYDKSNRNHCLGNVKDIFFTPKAKLKLPVISASDQVCPAVNFTSTGCVDKVPIQVFALSKVNKLVLDYLEGKMQGNKKFTEYIDNTAIKMYNKGINEIFDKKMIEEKAELILKRIVTNNI